MEDQEEGKNTHFRRVLSRDSSERRPEEFQSSKRQCRVFIIAARQVDHLSEMLPATPMRPSVDG
jgi:hypothetical protein